LTSTATIIDADPEHSAEQRFEILKTGLHIFADHPLLGVGIGCYGLANDRYAPELGTRDAHNTYVSLAAETGIPGLLLWLGLVWSVIAQARRRRAALAADDSALQVLWIERAVIAYLVAGFFGTFYVLATLYLVLGVLWVAANVLGQDATAGSDTPTAPRSLNARHRRRHGRWGSNVRSGGVA
jgi:O-antigen ligase